MFKKILHFFQITCLFQLVDIFVIFFCNYSLKTSQLALGWLGVGWQLGGQISNGEAAAPFTNL